MGETISVNAKDGGAFDVYLAKPTASRRPAPGVIIIQEAFGVTTWLKDITDRFAAEGYVAAAPDFYWRFAPNFAAGFDDEEALATARRHLQTIDHAAAVDDIDATSGALKSMDECNGKIATAGQNGQFPGGSLLFTRSIRLQDGS